MYTFANMQLDFMYVACMWLLCTNYLDLPSLDKEQLTVIRNKVVANNWFIWTDIVELSLRPDLQTVNSENHGIYYKQWL